MNISQRAMSYLTVFSRQMSYQSLLSLKNIYPASSLKLTTPTKPTHTDLSGKFSGVIPLEELKITYSRSSGPGGQNVNTVNTKVDLRFHVATAKWLEPEVRESIIEKNKTKISKDGFLIIRSELTRSQQLNLADALEKLRGLIRAAIVPPTEQKPETAALIARRLEKSNRERLYVKRHRSQIKSDRQTPDALL